LTSFDYTYKKPNEEEYLRGLMAYLTSKGETDLANLLKGSKCTIQPSSTYGSRGFVYLTSVYFQILPSKLALVNDEIRQKLTKFCDDTMPKEVGFEVAEVDFSPVLGKSSEAQEEPIKESRELWDLFICHATEDKDEIARPLANALSAKGLKVWYDEFTLKVGDSLRQKIDFGLAHSRYGIVILSQFFFKKNWPQRELDGLAAREDSEGHKVILPVWLHVDRDYVVKFSPTLADRLASRSSDGLDIVVKELLDVIMEPSPPSEVPERQDSAIKTTLGIDVDNDMKLMFREYAERLTPSHLKVLEFLDSPHEYAERNSVRFGSYMAGDVSTILEEGIPELRGRRGFYDQVVGDLCARGLISIDQNGIHVMMSESGMFASRTTEEGKKFLIFMAERGNRNAGG
jgi:hypothetical protein